jgi:hypothetical protein
MRRICVGFLLLAFVGAGCGSGTEATLDPLADAATHTRNASSVRFHMVMDVEAEGEHVTIGGPGEVSDHGHRLRMHMTMPRRQLGIPGEGTARFEMVSVGNSFYFRGGPFSDLPGGKEWVRVQDTSPLADVGQNDPATMLEYLAATSEVTEKGEERIRGAHTKHYGARIQVDKLAERASPDTRPQVEKLVKAMRDSGIDEIPLDVWVDDQGLVRREAMNWHPQGGSIDLKVDFFDFGKPVHIRIPPRAETMTVK